MHACTLIYPVSLLVAREIINLTLWATHIGTGKLILFSIQEYVLSELPIALPSNT